MAIGSYSDEMVKQMLAEARAHGHLEGRAEALALVTMLADKYQADASRLREIAAKKRRRGDLSALSWGRLAMDSNRALTLEDVAIQLRALAATHDPDGNWVNLPADRYAAMRQVILAAIAASPRQTWQPKVGDRHELG